MTAVDEYIKEVIRRGDEGSRLLAQKCVPTLENSNCVKIIESPAGNLTVLNIPKEYDVVVHSATGDPKKTDVEEHARSMVARLYNQAMELGVMPIGFANVIDSRTGDLGMLEKVVAGLVSEANSKDVAILNGENAILGELVVGEANVCGTMISLVEKGNDDLAPNRPLLCGDISLVRFDPKGEYVSINADGVGTKTVFHTLVGKPEGALRDFAAMNLDDASKMAATARVVSGVLEINGEMPMGDWWGIVRELGEQLNVPIILQLEQTEGRIKKYCPNYGYNLSGAVVSTIDKERLQNPLVPQAGEYLVAIVGKPNPRSNGITAKRKAMVHLFGEDYQNTLRGKEFLEFLAEPSTVLYRVFKGLIDEGLATSVYHMSGGAFNGKLARPLAQHNLFVRLNNLFAPDWREIALSGVGFTSAEDAYTKWPMGNDGFVATREPDNVITKIESQGLKARVVGQLGKAVGDKTGVELETLSGKVVYFSGKD